MAAEPPKALRGRSLQPPSAADVGLSRAPASDGEIACAVCSRSPQAHPRLPPRRYSCGSPRCRTCDGPSVRKTALQRTKQAGVTPPQPLTLTLVTPVLASLMPLVRATDRRACLCGRNPHKSRATSPGRAAGTCTPCALAAIPMGPPRPGPAAYPFTIVLIAMPLHPRGTLGIVIATMLDIAS